MFRVINAQRLTSSTTLTSTAVKRPVLRRHVQNSVITSNAPKQSAASKAQAVAATASSKFVIHPTKFTKAILIMGGFMGGGDFLYQVTMNDFFDPVRTATMFLIGAFITGPPTQTFQMFIEHKLPGTKRLKVIIKALAATTWVLSAYVPLLFTAKTVLRKNSEGRYGYFSEVQVKMMKDFFPNIPGGLVFWPAVFSMVFTYVTVLAYRPIVNSFFTTCWNLYTEAYSNKRLPWQTQEEVQDKLEQDFYKEAASNPVPVMVSA